jgi:hypothetical protein
MKRTILNTSIALAVAGFLGTGAALAQYSAPSATSPTAAPNAPSAAGAQATPPSGMAATPDASKSPSANQAAAPGRTESASSAFGKLDMKHRGYVDSGDVSQLQGFNFKNADKNNDGKLDATEFNTAWATYSGAPK